MVTAKEALINRCNREDAPISHIDKHCYDFIRTSPVARTLPDSLLQRGIELYRTQTFLPQDTHYALEEIIKRLQAGVIP